MKRIGFFIVTVFVLTVSVANGQERTVGLLLNTADSFKGYTLFAPMSYNRIYLINNEGLLVHSWKSDGLQGMPVYLGPDGYLYRSVLSNNESFSYLWGGGVEKLDWEGTVVWRYEYSNLEHHAHHDIGILPNGNVLMIAWERKDTAEVLAAGRNPALMPAGGLWPDHLVEIQPEGETGGTIVWEWHLWDHLVQDFDPTKNNYGVVREHPELIDLNYAPEIISDWNHLNTIAYDPVFDQILLTSRSFSEIWAIDHSTTTAEARSHTGGRYGKGGDLLYRWGNPEVYDQGDDNDQMLFYPHDGNWVATGLNILIFNNGGVGTRIYSSVDEIVPPVDGYGNYTGGLPYGPKGPIWTYCTFSQDFFSPLFSGAQRLPNGNTLICDGLHGAFFEVTPAGEVVWRYINPVNIDGPVYQGDSITNNSVFKIWRYPPDYPGFAGRDLTPGDPIEKYRAIEEDISTNRVALDVSSPFIRHSLSITYQLDAPGQVRLLVATITGQVTRTLVDGFKPAGKHRVVWDGTDTAGRRSNAGIYFLILETGGGSRTTKVVMF